MLSQQTVRPWGFSSLQAFDGFLYFFYCKWNIYLGYIPHYPLRLGSVLQYLILAQPGLDYQKLQIGLDLMYMIYMPLLCKKKVGLWRVQ